MSRASHARKSRRLQEPGEFGGRPGPPLAHGEEVEREIGGTDGLGAANTRHGLRDEHGPAGVNRRARATKEANNGVIVMIVENTHERDEVCSLRQGIDEEVASMGANPGGLVQGCDPNPSTFCDSGEVEELQLELWMSVRHGKEKRALTPAQVQNSFVAGEVVTIEDLGRNERLRTRHQG